MKAFCGICSKSFACQASLTRHVREMHTYRERFACPHCRKTSKRLEHMREHVRRLHRRHVDCQQEIPGSLSAVSECHGRDFTGNNKTLLQARLTQSDSNCDELKNELANCKENCARLQEEKDNLHHRLKDQEATITDLRSRLLRSEIDKNREQVVSGWMSHRDDEVAHLKDDVKTQTQIISRQKSELQRLHHEMITRDDAESGLLQKLRHKEHLVSNLQDRICQLSRRLEVGLSQISNGELASDSQPQGSSSLHRVSGLSDNDTQSLPESDKMSTYIYASQDTLIL